MDKIKSWDELKKVRADYTGNNDQDQTVVAVGMATCGVAAGAKAISEAITNEVQKQGLNNISVTTTGCYGFCYAEPMIEIREPGKPPVRYGYLDQEAVREIVKKHLKNGKTIKKYMLTQEVDRP